ncbi:MAG: hypothetical protein R3356_01515 [Eudoraea sp.]|nr:hypothetical protein [Eudoraea sp.]
MNVLSSQSTLLIIMFRSILFLLAISTLIISCGSDDGSGGTNEPAPVIGSWDLIELNISPAQDVDEDGTANGNLLDELNCISGVLTINDVGTWSLNLNGVTVTSITGGLFDISCNPAPSFNSGTWAFQNNRLTQFLGDSNIVLSLNNDRLTNLVGGTLPEFFSEVYQKR